MVDTRRDTRLIVGATVTVVLAGLLVAAAIFLVTRRGTPPRAREPIVLGIASSLEEKVRTGGPVAYAGTSGDDGTWLALENGRLVALLVRQPGDCNVRWRGTLDSFVDCRQRRVRTVDLVRYRTEIPRAGDRKGAFLVDLRRVVPAPEASARREEQPGG